MALRSITFVYLAYLIAPILLLLVGSFGGVWTNTLLPSGITSQWYVAVASDPSFRRAFLTSLGVALATCLAGALIAVPLAYALFTSGGRRTAIVVRIAATLPLIVPELVLAFGYLLVFSSDTLPWLGSIWLLIAAHVTLTLPYLLGTLLADLQTLRLHEMEQVAASLGAPFATRFFTIVLPSLRHSIGSGLIAVAALSIGEFQVSNLIAGFLSRTYPVVLLQAFYGATGFACAATVVLLVLALSGSSLSALAGRNPLLRGAA